MANRDFFTKPIVTTVPTKRYKPHFNNNSAPGSTEKVSSTPSNPTVQLATTTTTTTESPIRGLQGYQGYSGFGQQGPMGPNGEFGLQGYQGSLGLQGYQGSTGASGIIFSYSETTGTNTYSATLTPTPTSYTEGMEIALKIMSTNTATSSTINVNGLGPKPLVKNGTASLAVGDLVAGQIYNFTYDGVNFQGDTTLSGLLNWWIGTKADLTQWDLTFLSGVSNRLMQVDSYGNVSATYEIATLYVSDSDITTAIVGASYSSGNSFTTSISPANSKIFLQGQRYNYGSYIYEAVADNIAARITLG